MEPAESGGTVHAFEIDARVRAYLEGNVIHEPAVLARLRGVIETEELPEMATSPEQGQLLALLIRLLDAKKVLDVGFFRGYSALTMALALPPGGVVVACERNVSYAASGLPFWTEGGVAGKLDLRIGDALHTLSVLRGEGAEGTFDVAFLDADKAKYPLYYHPLLALLRPGGLLVIDNVMWLGRVMDEQDQEASTQGVRELNRMVRDDATVEAFFIPVRDGMSIVRKPLQNRLSPYGARY